MAPRTDPRQDPPPLGDAIGTADQLSLPVLGGATATELRSKRVASILDALSDVVAAYDAS